MLILLFISFLASAQTHEQIKESIDQVISIRHPTDKKQTWLSMGADTPLVIMEMLDAGVDAYKRIRLLEALGYFQSPAVSECLRKEAKTAKNPQYRISSLKGLFRSEGQGAIEFAKEFLEDTDPDVQKTVATEIDRITDDEREIQPKTKIKPIGKLKPSGSNESKPELALLGQWSGYTLAWDAKKKQITPKRVQVIFDMGLGDRLILKHKQEDQKNFTEANIEKEKWKWSNPDQPEVLELSSEVKKIRFFVSSDIR